MDCAPPIMHMPRFISPVVRSIYLHLYDHLSGPCMYGRGLMYLRFHVHLNGRYLYVYLPLHLSAPYYLSTLLVHLSGPYYLSTLLSPFVQSILFIYVVKSICPVHIIYLRCYVHLSGPYYLSTLLCPICPVHIIYLRC